MNRLTVLIILVCVSVWPYLVSAADTESPAPANQTEPPLDFYLLRFEIQNASGSSRAEFAFSMRMPMSFTLPERSTVSKAADGRALSTEEREMGWRWIEINPPLPPGINQLDVPIFERSDRKPRPGDYTKEALELIKAAAPHYELGGVEFQVYAPLAARMSVQVWRITGAEHELYQSVRPDNSLPYFERMRQLGYTYLGSLNCAVTCPDLGPLPTLPEV